MASRIGTQQPKTTEIVVTFISNDEMKRYGWDEYRHDFPEIVNKRHFIYRKNGNFIPAYMIKKEYTLKEGCKKFPELFL